MGESRAQRQKEKVSTAGWRLLCPPCVCWELPGTGGAHPAVTTALWCQWGCLFTPGSSLYQWPHHLAQHLPWPAAEKGGCILPKVRTTVSQTEFPPLLPSAPLRRMMRGLNQDCLPHDGPNRLPNPAQKDSWPQRGKNPLKGTILMPVLKQTLPALIWDFPCPFVQKLQALPGHWAGNTAEIWSKGQGDRDYTKAGPISPALPCIWDKHFFCSSTANSPWGWLSGRRNLRKRVSAYRNTLRYEIQMLGMIWIVYEVFDVSSKLLVWTLPGTWWILWTNSTTWSESILKNRCRCS